MDTQAIAAAIQAEIARLSQALSILTGGATVKRRGRSPNSSMPDWVTSNGAAAATPTPALARKKRTFSLAQRKAQAEKMRQYWAAKRKAGTKKTPAKKTAKQAAAATA